MSNVDWDTIVNEDATCTRQVGNIDIDVTNAGHYLVMYSLPTDSPSGSNRSELQTWLRLNNTTDLQYGRGRSYIRRNHNNFEGYNHGATILDLAA